MVALITPFDDFGHVDFDALGHLIHWHIEAKTDAIVFCGSTGEGSSLMHDENLQIFRFGVASSKGQIPIIAGVGATHTAACVELTRKAKEAGVDATLSIVPYYSRPTEEGCLRHFLSIAEIELPMIVYHHPGRTGLKLSARALADICEIPEVLGVKEASGDLSLALKLMYLTEKPLFSGDDGIALAHLGAGFQGSISIVANMIPERWSEFVKTALKGDMTSARKRFFEIYPLCEAMVLETNPQCVKYGVSLLEKCKPHLREPLLEPTNENKLKIEEALNSTLCNF